MSAHSNRLLDMLKSATSPPPAPPPASALSPPAPGSPREPSPIPPPPSLQAVSLQDLFANITSPPTATTSPPTQETHQASLLGMLKGIGAPTETSTTKDHSSSGGSTPSSFGAIGSGAAQGDQKGNLLNSSISNGNGSAQALAHPTVQPSSSSSTPAEAIAPPINKSMFDFVSPFDVFDKPKTKAIVKNASPAPSNGNAPAQVPLPPRVPSPNKPSVPSQPLTKGEPRQRQPSNSGSQFSSTSKDLGLPHQISKVVPKGTIGTGPKTTEKDIVIDVSKPNIDSLVNNPGTVQIIPTTIMKADHIGFSPNRSVGITPGWLAYALGKGRVRLIDSTSGSRLVLQTLNASAGPIIDLAVVADRVAVVGNDHAVTVFKVPTNWQTDNPPCEIVSHIQYDPSALGVVNRVEWIRKAGSDHLAIGGDAGVVIVHPDEVQKSTFSELERNTTVFKTEGPIAGFCINHSHQAIGLLSTKSHFTLYNVSNSLRVWNRPLPTATPSSVSFVEPNILVGRDNNTIYDLVQITGETTILSTIKFIGESQFTQPVYDSARNILWISVFGRGTLYGFRYALKGQAPVKVSGGSVAAFDKVAEYTLEPAMSLVLNAKAVEHAEVFFATPSGFSMAHIEKSACETLSAAQLVEVKTEKVDTPKKAPKVVKPKPSPTPIKADLPAVEVEETLNGDAAKNEDLSRLLKRSEDKIANNLKQVLGHQLGQINTRLESLSSSDLGVQVANKVKAVVQTEIQRSIPSISSSVQGEVSRTLQTAVATALAGTSTQLEKTLAPSIQRSVANAVQHSVDRAIQEAVQSTLVPLINSECQRVADRLSQEYKSEMLQLRKDDTHDTDALIRALASSMTDLQRQVGQLSDQLSRSGPAQPVAPTQHNVPSQPVLPPGSVLEDTFLAALGAQNTPATLSLIQHHWPLTEAIFPNPPNKSILSQPVLLTLLHRLSHVLLEVHFSDPAFHRAVRWGQKAASLVDHRSPELTSFYPRVHAVVNGALGNALHNLASAPPSPQQAEAINGIRSILDILAQKV